jgi:hypothetical protein
MSQSQAAKKRYQKNIPQRRVSQSMKNLLKESDLGYCEDQSDTENLYYFTLRNMEEMEKILCDHTKFSETVSKLRKIVFALFPKVCDFKFEWKKYKVMFMDYFTHAKASTKNLTFIQSLFDRNVDE